MHPSLVNKENIKASCTSRFNSDDLQEAFFDSDKTYIHKTAILGPDVTLEQGVKIGPFCIIIGNVKIGKNTKIYPNVSIGSTAQHVKINKPLGKIEIGKNCNIREFATIGSCASEEGQTIIGDNCYIMSYSHIAHDVILENNVILVNNTNLGGHTYIEKNAFLMANSATHQFCRIGQFCALAACSATAQDLPPFCMFNGLPAKFFGLNRVALKRANFSNESINAIKHVAKLFYQDKLLLTDIKKILLNEYDLPWATDPNVQAFIKFIENSKRGVSKK